MIERVHEHLLDELTNNARTDTVFVITAILLNLIVLAINSTIAASSANGNGSGTRTIIMATFTVLVIVVNLVAEIGLIRGRQMRRKLLNGLLKMYQDQGVAGYYDPSLLSDYRTRYDLFLLAVLVTGLVSIIIPFIIR